MMMPFKRQALVEFEDIESAKKCVTFAADEPVYIAGQQAFFNYSTSKRITRPGNTDDPSGGNKVLLLSIQNPLYPITVVCLLYSVNHNYLGALCCPILCLLVASLRLPAYFLHWQDLRVFLLVYNECESILMYMHVFFLIYFVL